MDADRIVAEYLAAITTADTDRMLVLFAEDAVVHSPLYGEQPATEFYPKLFADTEQAVLTPRGVTSGTTASGGALVMFLFSFDWTLVGGADRVVFDVVDVLELDDHAHITSLRIVYDTFGTREAFGRATGAGS